MIPTNRFIAATLLLLPAGMVPAFAPQWNFLALALIAAFILMVAGDALASLSILRGIDLQLPKLVRTSAGREFSLAIVVRAAEGGPGAITLAINIPEHFRSPHEVVAIPLSPPQTVKAFWPVLATERGRFTVSSSRVAAVSRLGFWEIRESRPHTTEIRVYPNLFTEKRSLAALLINKSGSSVHAPRQIGQGREFEKLREYLPGDSMDSIHWKATAKKNIPMSKVFQLERTQEIYVLIDNSRLSGQPLGPDRQSENYLDCYLKAGLVMGLAARKYGDLFGLVTFSSKVNTFLRAKSGKSHFNSCQDHLYRLQAEQVSPDFSELAVFIRQHLKKRSLLIIMTNLGDPVLAENFMHSMALINRQHLILTLTMNPPTAMELFSRDTVSCLDDIYHHLAGHIQDQALLKLEKELLRRGIQFFRPDRDSLSLHLVQRYLAVKRRQAL